MRLIDADALSKLVGEPIEVFLRRLDLKLPPTVNAEPVVRCKDCMWYKESKHSELRPMRFCYRLKNDDGVAVGYNWDGNDFCSHGERREDERTAAYYGDNKLIETVVIDERNDDGKTD